VIRLTAPVILTLDADDTVIRDGALDIVGGKIAYCGPRSTAPEFAGEVTELDGVLLPGLINTHAHTPMTLLRGLGGDLPLMQWLQTRIWPAEGKLQPGDIRSGQLLGGIEMLRGGTTTSVEMYFGAEELAEAATALGSRMLLGLPVMGLPGMDWRQQLTDIDKLIDDNGLYWPGNPRVEVAYGPHSAYTLPPEALELTAKSARERGALLTIHVAESQQEDVAQRADYQSVPRLLDEHNVYGGRFIAAHSIQLDDHDISLFAANDVAVASCPVSNAKLAAGIARVPELRKAGVTVGLATDGPASNDTLDLWDEMRMAANVARLRYDDAMALTANDTLRMATVEGAKAIGHAADLGQLVAGFEADIVHVSGASPAFVAGLDVPDAHLVSNLVWGGGGRSVTDVWIAGDKVLASGNVVGVDEREVRADARVRAQRLMA
jgi:5-methylthioadenosine/S-adenosylhomocysteine deaminase